MLNVVIIPLYWAKGAKHAKDLEPTRRLCGANAGWDFGRTPHTVSSG